MGTLISPRLYKDHDLFENAEKCLILHGLIAWSPCMILVEEATKSKGPTLLN